jgi:hypothetical protein
VFFSRFLREKFTRGAGIWRNRGKLPGAMAPDAVLQDLALSVLIEMQIE